MENIPISFGGASSTNVPFLGKDWMENLLIVFFVVMHLLYERALSFLPFKRLDEINLEGMGTKHMN